MRLTVDRGAFFGYSSIYQEKTKTNRMSENKEKLFELKETSRGFTVGYFNDLYNNPCSIQESSLADRAAIWLGVHENRMHLSIEMVRELLTALKCFVQTGYLPDIKKENE